MAKVRTTPAAGVCKKPPAAPRALRHAHYVDKPDLVSVARAGTRVGYKYRDKSAKSSVVAKWAIRRPRLTTHLVTT